MLFPKAYKAVEVGTREALAVAVRNCTTAHSFQWTQSQLRLSKNGIQGSVWVSARGWARPLLNKPSVVPCSQLSWPWRPPLLEQEAAWGPREFSPTPQMRKATFGRVCSHSEMAEGSSCWCWLWVCPKGRGAACPVWGQHCRTLQQLPQGCCTIALGDPVFSCPKWLQDALPVRASLLTAFSCREISSFMAAKFSRLVEMTSLMLSNSLLMKGNSETALFRVEQWWSKVVLQERKDTRCKFINYFI